MQPNKRLARKLPADTECASLLIGHVDFLDDLVIAYFRFRSPTVVDGLTEVALSTRFLFIAVGPPEASSIVELSELGRAFATLLNDKVSTIDAVFPYQAILATTLRFSCHRTTADSVRRSFSIADTYDPFLCSVIVRGDRVSRL